MNICINPFVLRQTKESPFSYFEGTKAELIDLVSKHFPLAKKGYRDGVILVPVPPDHFFSGIVQLEAGAVLNATFVPRREGEQPRIQVTAPSRTKTPAQNVDIVLYASTVLAEDGNNTLDAVEGNWEVISINAAPTSEEVPIPLNALLYNHFGGDGGTATNMSDADFVTALRTSFEYWKDKAMCG